ncbi:MAG: lactate racemase domain-containing protein, partial [Gemmataceae bacterium]
MIFSSDRADREQLEHVLGKAVAASGSRWRKVLLIHPDYSRNDFSDRVFPVLYEVLERHGLERIDTLNAGGTHRPMTAAELRVKLGVDPTRHVRLGTQHNHPFDRPEWLSRLLLTAASVGVFAGTRTRAFCVTRVSRIASTSMVVL